MPALVFAYLLGSPLAVPYCLFFSAIQKYEHTFKNMHETITMHIRTYTEYSLF